jgi:AAA15 family ATPase/GTPase
MLLRFSVANFRSILEEQELSLVAGKLKSAHEILRFPIGDVSVLPSALIYGPNAAGKSNFIAALNFLRAAVLYSHSKGNPDGGVPRKPFALCGEAQDTPSLLEADFVVGGVRYQYGFEADDDRFTAEWLFSYPEGKRRKLYERSGDDISFGPSLKGQKKILAEFMRPNSLFLSTATQNDHEELSEIRNFFKDIKIKRSISAGRHTVNEEFSESDIDPRTIEFLEMVGTGVIGYRKNTEELPDEARKMMSELKVIIKRFASDNSNEIEIDSSEEKRVSIELSHKSRDGSACYLDLNDESAGTKRLLIIINMAFKALDTGGIVVIDEVDASLHTFASEAVLALFNDKNINKKGAQIIATAHDTNLLSSEFLSRGQIWFAEKNDRGETELFSLAEIKSRPDDNFELGYLQGRYGGTISPPRRWDFQRLNIGNFEK